MKRLKYEQAFDVLWKNARSWGVDMVVDNPGRVIERSMGVAYTTALQYLKELERRNLVVFVRNGVGNSIESLRLVRKELPVRAHEMDEETRLVNALWKYRRSLELRPGKFMVHANFFDDVHAATDVHQTRFYMLLRKFVERGWLIEERKTTNDRLLFVEFTDSFPLCNKNK